MAKIWKGVYGQRPPKGSYAFIEYEKPARPATRSSLRSAVLHSRLQRAADAEMWFVRVCSFTFHFTNLKALDQCLAYYSRKTHPSSRISAKKLASDLGKDWKKLRSWEVERWFERLPMYLLEERKRKQVVKALTKAKLLWRNELGDSTLAIDQNKKGSHF